jgi:hypothetical protein
MLTLLVKFTEWTINTSQEDVSIYRPKMQRTIKAGGVVVAVVTLGVINWMYITGWIRSRKMKLQKRILWKSGLRIPGKFTI